MNSLSFFTHILLLLLSLFTYAPLTQCASPKDWSSRTIYQVITDRFSQTVNSSQPCSNWSNYCGGTWRGLINHLDYISGMGFDAIWISPIPHNFPSEYHGYAAQDLNTLNEHFGSVDDLKALSAALHARDMYLMVDVVANHMGIPAANGIVYNYSQIQPFNQAEYYHDCTNCPSDCSIADFSNQLQVELCRLSGLSDLNQSHPYVATTLCNWISQIQHAYSIDGFRIDTIAEVVPSFWVQFQKSALAYAVGEVFNVDVPNHNLDQWRWQRRNPESFIIELSSFGC